MARPAFEPGYRTMLASGELSRRADALEALLRLCEICPRKCRVDRRREPGACRTPAGPVVASWGPHLGEEPPLSGDRGSGTVFLANCNLRCAYCQNADISQPAQAGRGGAPSAAALAAVMLEIQGLGCHNVNWVSPTHQVPALVRALLLAAERGLRLPIVYNSNGYDAPEVLALLDGIVDIYLADFKYTDGAMAARYSSDAADYPAVAQAALIEMQRQVGSLVTDRGGVALRGLMIRHLVLPEDIAGTRAFVRFVAEKLGPATYVNLMSQYRPEYQAACYPQLARRITRAEYQRAVEWAREAGLARLDLQG